MYLHYTVYTPQKIYIFLLKNIVFVCKSSKKIDNFKQMLYNTVVMNFIFNEKLLEKNLKDVYELIKTPISVFDFNFEWKASYPPTGYLTTYCDIIRKSPLRKNRCLECDKQACAICQSAKTPYTYYCHAHVCETISPIYYDNVIAGFFLFGQYIQQKDFEQIKKYAQEQNINETQIIDAYDNLTILSPTQINAACNVLQASILNIWATDAIRRDDNDKLEKIREYILNHLHLPLTADFLCKKFFIGKQQLYALFRQNNQITLKQYILEKKIEQAKKLLRTTNLNVTEIAEAVGFSDYNNFIQRFKMFTGVPPLKYRRQEQEHTIVHI